MVSGLWSLVAGEHVGPAAVVAKELLHLLHGGPDPLVEDVEEVEEVEEEEKVVEEEVEEEEVGEEEVEVELSLTRSWFTVLPTPRLVHMALGVTS